MMKKFLVRRNLLELKDGLVGLSEKERALLVSDYKRFMNFIVSLRSHGINIQNDDEFTHVTLQGNKPRRGIEGYDGFEEIEVIKNITLTESESIDFANNLVSNGDVRICFSFNRDKSFYGFFPSVVVGDE